MLQTLSPEMPLQLASDTILRMLRARLHHHRQGQVSFNNANFLQLADVGNEMCSVRLTLHGIKLLVN